MVRDYKMVQAFLSSIGSSAHVESKTDTHVKSVCRDWQGFAQKLSFPPKAPLKALIVFLTDFPEKSSSNFDKLPAQGPKK